MVRRERRESDTRRALKYLKAGDVGRQQDVVPQRAPIALRLHVGGTFVVELKGGTSAG